MNKWIRKHQYILQVIDLFGRVFYYVLFSTKSKGFLLGNNRKKTLCVSSVGHETMYLFIK